MQKKKKQTNKQPIISCKLTSSVELNPTAKDVRAHDFKRSHRWVWNGRATDN